ncbi:ABC transporter permease [Mucilaginibacter ginsenosidivorans]|uniref:FtsX-like permease family protein n=1 Tax=Mucilaginibacter ginsenosidivorans TaxID=398053 RepID=A0A5B8UZG9_9SPHI|nr:ABC transporter permease [Mucilaginibacter ginsenosidivorans]QEC64155.1 FtsX-like permease family protein [Mucilaginibacter ginsenosidivorans]
MIKNYFKVAWRNLRKNSLYSLINIGGLTIGMAVSFMLLIYVYNEFSFDKFNQNTDRLYRVLRNQPSNGELMTNSATPIPLAPAMIKDYPEFDKVARTNWPYDILVNYKNKALKLNTMAADPAILDMFTFEFVHGDKKTALSDLSSIVLTESAARSVFGDANPIGQTIKLNNQYLLKVSAVIRDNPVNSSFNFAALISWDQLAAEQTWLKTSSWGNYSFMTYAMLKPNASLAAVNAKLKNIVAKHDPNNKENTIFLSSFAKFHLYSDFKNGVAVGGEIEHVRLFLFLALGILLIACINFMNLSTARSERRAREVGIRKAIGARRSGLVMQFMGESLLMAFISFVFSVILIYLLIDKFATIINTKLAVPYSNPYTWLAALGVILVTGVIAGSYPALFLSSFKPVKVLKGQLVSVKSTVNPRKVLVILQFSFATFLILSSIFIYKQIIYIKNRPVGYDQRGLVELPDEGNMDKQFESFRRDLISAGAVTDAALTGNSISNNNSSSWGITWAKQLPGEDKLPIDQIAVTYHFISTYGLKLVEGRDFSEAYPADSTAIIINQAAVKLMRFKEPLGQTVKYQGNNCSVVGVVENFVWGSPHEPVKPAIIGFIKGWTGSIGLRLNPAKTVSASMAIIQDIYKKYNPEYPFEYKFVDEKFANKFRTEKMLGTMAVGFTCLAIIISCLGLFGLASFSAEQRRKEIGIRKVLGATISSIWYSLSREFVVLVLIAFPIGAVFSWYMVDKWMSDFTYHTSLSWWVFVATIIASLVICVATVSWQAIKAALTNPVKSLRSE